LLLGQYGTVLTEHVGDGSLSTTGEKEKTDSYIYNRDMEWLAQADVVVAEVTMPSLGVGYELARAEEMKKPVLCLFQKNTSQKLSAMIAGDAYFKVEQYESEQDLVVILERFFSSV